MSNLSYFIFNLKFCDTHSREAPNKGEKKNEQKGIILH